MKAICKERGRLARSTAISGMCGKNFALPQLWTNLGEPCWSGFYAPSRHKNALETCDKNTRQKRATRPHILFHWKECTQWLAPWCLVHEFNDLKVWKMRNRANWVSWTFFPVDVRRCPLSALLVSDVLVYEPPTRPPSYLPVSRNNHFNRRQEISSS